ncbi:MAG: NTP transferase domain-containing protein [Candidatus Marinimicrobia bacterium]|nr:NTP transferase domain-containing protein [Candidatus Neomarinimicrobiota bacterium]
MRVIIPIAGLGTRLLPHTKRRQKCLLPVAEKPVLDHIVEPLLESGFDHIVLVTGYLEEQVKEYVKKFDAEFSFVRQEKALGLGHAVFQGLEDSGEPVLIQLGDVIYDIDFTDFCSSPHHIIAVNEVPDPQRFGIVETEGDQIVAVHEKPEDPPTNLAIVGLYYLSRQKPMYDIICYLIDNNITTKGEIQLADAYQYMIDRGEKIGFQPVSNYYDCGIPETFLTTNRALLKPSEYQIEGSTINDPVFIGENCIIRNSVVGPYVTVMDGATIIDSVVTDSIVLWNASIEGRKVDHEIVEEGKARQIC